jgi:hypothetical protein
MVQIANAKNTYNSAVSCNSQQLTIWTEGHRRNEA